MRNWLIVFKTIAIVIACVITVVMGFIIFDKAFFVYGGDIDPELAGNFGDFLGGFIGTLFGFLSVMVVAYSILKQSLENRKNNVRSAFFQMIDYHYRNVEQIELPGNRDCMEKQRRGFVAYKIQFKRLLQALSMINNEHDLGLNGHDIASIAYMVFYYGLNESWENFLEDKISCYDCRQTVISELLKISKDNPDMHLCRTNQTILSAYFRNMYNAIRMIDEDSGFSKKEKKDLIRIYRAQLSNPELYILFFNLISPFGKKWRDKEYVTKYSLLKNLPYDYLDGYNATDFFKLKYEYEEINCATGKDEFENIPLPDIKSNTQFG